MEHETRSRSLLSFIDDIDADHSASDDEVENAYSAEDYLRVKSRDDPLDCSLFALMEPDQQLEVLAAFDELEVIDDQANIGSSRREVLEFEVEHGTQPRSIWTSEFESRPVVVVHEKSDLPDLNDTTGEDAVNWLHSNVYHSVAAAFPSAGCASYQANIDVDATTLLTDTLKLVKAPIRMHVTPHDHLYADKIKHTWRGASLGSKINFEFGTVDSRLAVLLVLPQFDKSHPLRKQLIRALYKTIYTGIRASSQAGSSGLKKDLDSLIEDPNARTARTTLLVSSFEHVENEIKSFRFNHHKVEVLWVFQYFGDKFHLSGEEAIQGYVDYLGTLFDLDAICDPSNADAQNAIFTQDIALTIASTHNNSNPISIAWNTTFSKSLGDTWNSALRSLLRYNKRYEHVDANVKNGSTQLFNNLGIGTLKSAMVDWHSKKVLVKGVKAYFAGSEYWRNNAPYADKCFAVLALPMENILACSTITDADQTLLLKQKKTLEKTFNSKLSETTKIESIMSIMQRSSYGARLEVTLQNTDQSGLLEAYQVLKDLGNAIIRTHVALTDLYEAGKIPFVTMRFSPLQVMNTRSLFSLAAYQAHLINNMFSALFNSAMGANRDDTFNPDVVNALALLENIQQLLWSGSLVNVNNPALVNRLGLIKLIDEFGRVYMPRTIFQYNNIQPLLTVVNLPRGNTLSEEPFVATQLALSRRCFRRAFGGVSTEFLRIFSSYSSILQLFIVPRNSFFSHIYPSKTNIMATNILNCFFTELFLAMDVDYEHHMLLFAQLCLNAPAIPPSLPVKAITASVTAGTLLDIIFKCNGTVPDNLLDTKFAKMWRLAYSVIPYLTSSMKWSSFGEFRELGAQAVSVRAAVRLQDVRDQMLILLHQAGLRFIPVVGASVQDGLVISHGGSYLVGGLSLPYNSTVLLNNNRQNGIPLPHPVDGSFIFMLAEKIAVRKCKSRQQQMEFLGHILYHYTKVARSERMPCPRYRTVTVDLLVASGLLTLQSRSTFDLLSLNDLYQLYTEL